MFRTFRNRLRNVAKGRRQDQGEDSLVPDIVTFDKPGLHIVAGSKETTEVDIVFVHGLGRSSQTWPASKSDLWPRTLLPMHFPQARIMLFSYDVELIDFTKGFRLNFLSQQLIQKLQDIREDKKRPIIFVAHSLGGLLVKQVIVDSAQDAKSRELIAEHVIGILFFGTPHKGSSFADWTHILARISMLFDVKNNASVVMSLRSIPEELSHIDSQFFGIVRERQRRDRLPPINLVTFYEMFATQPMGMIVPQESAVLPGFLSQGIASNHKNLAHFADQNDIGYRSFLHQIERSLLGSESLDPQSRVMREEPQTTLSRIFREGGSYSTAEDLQRQIAESTRLAYGDTDERFLWEWKRLADVYFARGLWNDAKDALDDIHNTYLANRSGYSDRLAWGLLNSLSLLLLELGQHRAAQTLANECLALNPALESQCIAQDILAAALFQLGLYEGSMDLRRSLVEKARLAFGDSFRAVQAEAALGRTLLFLGNENSQSAHHEQKKALDIFQDIFGDRHPISLQQANMLAFLELRSFLYEMFPPMAGTDALKAALNSCKKGAYGLREALGPEHPFSLQASHNLAIALALGGHDIEAKIICASVSKSATRTFPVLHPFVSASRTLLTTLNAKGASKVLTKEVKEKGLLFNWAGSAQWLSILVLSGAAFDDPLHELQSTEQMLGSEHPRTLASMMRAAEVLRHQGKYGQAEQMHRQTLELKNKVFGSEHPDTLASMDNLALVLQQQGKYKEAEMIHQQTLTLRQNLLGLEHPDTLSSMNNLASGLYHQGKYEEAEMIHRQTLELMEMVLGKEHPDTLSSTDNLALVLQQQGRYKEADMIHWQTLTRRQNLLGSEHPDTLSSMNNLATVLRHQGKYEEAEMMHRKALELMEMVLGKEHPDTLSSMNNLATVLHHQGKYEEAEMMHRKALELMEMVLGKEHPDTLSSVDNHPDRAVSLNSLEIGLKNQDQQIGNVAGREEAIQLARHASADIAAKDRVGGTALSRAAEGGHEAVVRLLLDRGEAETDSMDNSGRTPLSCAAGRGHEDVVRLLLDRGADVAVEDRVGGTALSRAAGRGHEDVVRLLLDRGADVAVEDRVGGTALSRAAEGGHEAVVRLLLDKGADVAVEDRVGRTALSRAAEGGHEAVVRLLLDRGADVAVEDRVGGTALSRAAEGGHEAVVRLLLDKGADVAVEDRVGRTALSRAAEGGHEAVVRLLLDRGADVMAKDGEGETALSQAARGGYEAVVRLLLDRGADVVAKGPFAQTALLQAARGGHEAAVRLLLDRGADVAAKDQVGRTALSRAAEGGYDEVVRLLMSRRS